ncbi:MAG: CAP domain-containing protein [Lachnospiraceae bacterium]|nr:CAP domain-containing protein [Lachnospiraceae bacterium]
MRTHRNLIRNFMFIALLAAMIIAFLPERSLQAKTRESSDENPINNGILVVFKGTYRTDERQKALDRINEIRLEACKEGVLNPSTGQPLTESDYVPIKWSSDLELIAQTRAAEADVFWDHTRPNGKSCFSVSYNGTQSWGEVLAWNYNGNMVYGVNQWYGEKTAWVNQDSTAVTGHYTSMINPRNKYVGLGAFMYGTEKWICISGEFSSFSGLKEGFTGVTGDYYQVIEIPKNNLNVIFEEGTKKLTLGYENLDSWLSGDYIACNAYVGVDWNTLRVNSITASEIKEKLDDILSVMSQNYSGGSFSIQNTSQMLKPGDNLVYLMLTSSNSTGGTIKDIAWTVSLSDPDDLQEFSEIIISKQPESTTVTTGNLAYFNVKASGTGLEYLWQYKEKGKTTWTDWTNKKTASISVAYAAYRDGMSFRCVVTDASGSKVISNAATLTYNTPFAITAHPANSTVNAGELASFEVKASGKGLKYLWQYKAAGSSNWTDWTSKTTAKISVAYASYRDGMSFRCVVTDANGKKVTSNAATLTYNNPLIITTQPANTTVNSGELAYFEVKASGKGLKYLWQYKAAGSSTWTDWTSKTTAKISVAYASYRDGMSFRCIVTDASNKKVTSNVAVLTYSVPLEITKQPVSVTVNKGTLASFSVKATGKGLKYQWKYKNAGDTSWTTWSSKTKADITVAYATYRDGMSLRCVITDASGQRVTTSVVTLKYK